MMHDGTSGCPDCENFHPDRFNFEPVKQVIGPYPEEPAIWEERTREEQHGKR